MNKILHGSFIYRFFAAVYAFFSNQWQSSRLITRFLSPRQDGAASGSSVFSKLWRIIHSALCTVFEKLRLNRLLRGSIFTMPYIWCCASVALAPLLPTMAVLGLALVSIATLLLAFCCNRERTLAYSPINKYVLLYVIVYIVAVFTSVTVSGSLKGGALTALFTLTALVVQNAVRTRRQLDAMLYALVTAGALVSAYGVYQYVFGVTSASAWIDSKMFSDISVRVYSTLDNPNVLSEYLLLVIPFVFALILIVKKPIFKLYFLGCLGAMLLCMLLTISRGGWLGLVFAAAVFLVMLDRRFILVGIAGLIALYFALPDSIINRFLSIGNLGDSSTSYRLSIWLGTISMLRDYWFTGIGPGTVAFNKVYPLYSYNTAAAQHSHNLFLQITCDAGITGLAIFVLMLISYFRNLAASVSREKDRSTKILQIAAISSIAGFLVQSATDHSFYNYRVTLVFWAVVGLGAVIARRSALDGK